MNLNYFIFKSIHNLAGKSICLDSLGIFLAKDLIWFLLVLTFLIWFFHRKKIKFAQIFFLLLGSILLVYILVFLIQGFYFRLRPFIFFKIQPLIPLSPIETSFPSLHTSLAFVFAFVVYFINRKWGIVAILLALLVGLARIYVGVHWSTDILAGFLTALISFILTKKLLKNLNLIN